MIEDQTRVVGKKRRLGPGRIEQQQSVGPKRPLLLIPLDADDKRCVRIVRIPRKSSSRSTAKRAGIPREAERRFHSKASAADVATRGEFFYSFSSSVVKPFRRLRIDSPDSVSRCAL